MKFRHHDCNTRTLSVSRFARVARVARVVRFCRFARFVRFIIGSLRFMELSELLQACAEDSRFIFIHSVITEQVLNATYSQTIWKEVLQRVFDEVTITLVESNLYIAKATFAHSTLSYALIELEGSQHSLTASHYEIHE